MRHADKGERNRGRKDPVGAVLESGGAGLGHLALSAGVAEGGVPLPNYALAISVVPRFSGLLR